MKKLTVKEGERISISTIYHHEVRSICRLYPNIPISQFNAILDQGLEGISKSSIRVMGSLMIMLTKTVANFGGVRYWFVCPYCQRRVGTLYKPKNEIRFKCRHCYNLTYESTQTHDNRVKSAEQLILKLKKDYARHLIRRKPKLFWKLYDKHRPSFPSPYSIRRQKEEDVYNKYIKPLL